MITPKEEYIDKVCKLVCKKCCRPKRIKSRLEKEISDDEFDCDKDVKVAKVIQEEA